MRQSPVRSRRQGDAPRRVFTPRFGSPRRSPASASPYALALGLPQTDDVLLGRRSEGERRPPITAPSPGCRGPGVAAGGAGRRHRYRVAAGHVGCNVSLSTRSSLTPSALPLGRVPCCGVNSMEFSQRRCVRWRCVRAERACEPRWPFGWGARGLRWLVELGPSRPSPARRALLHNRREPHSTLAGFPDSPHAEGANALLHHLVRP